MLSGPGDLLTVTRGDWLAAARFGVRTLKEDSGAVFVGGFSLGGLLSIHALLDDAISGAFVFSPALALEDAWLVRQTVWLRHFLKWLDRDPPDDYARYEVMPVNATAETYLLTRELGRLLDRRRVRAPVFMALSADDPVIDAAAARGYFENRFSHPGSRLLVYRRDPQEGADPDDGRISYSNSFLPGNGSRASPISRSTSRPATRTTAPRATTGVAAAPDPWRGEVFGNSPAEIPEGEPVARRRCKWALTIILYLLSYGYGEVVYGWRLASPCGATGQIARFLSFIYVPPTSMPMRNPVPGSSIFFAFTSVLSG